MTACPTRYRMFIDDTGNVTSQASNHPQNRFASVTGVIFEWVYLTDKFEPGLLKLKEKHFGLLPHGKPPILHLRKMKKGQGPFSVLIDATKRADWERDCLTMYRAAKYHVVTTCVDKIAFYYKYPNWTGDIYKLLVGNAIERYFYFLRGSGIGDVMAEGVNGEMDEALKSLYRRFYLHGTDHVGPDKLQAVLTSKEIKIQTKNSDVAGLQMADMLASTCFSHCRRTYAKGPDYDKFAMSVADVMETRKFYRDAQGNPHRYGRLWRP